MAAIRVLEMSLQHQKNKMEYAVPCGMAETTDFWDYVFACLDYSGHALIIQFLLKFFLFI